MDTAPTIPIDYQPAVRDRAAWKPVALRAAIWFAIVVLLTFCAVKGLQLRRWLYIASDPIRFQDDMRRGTYWGLHASGPEGYLNQYDKMQPEVPEWQDNRWTPWLDYSPLRLAVMTGWGAWQWHHRPPDLNAPLMDAWQRDYGFAWPVLYFNTALEGLSCVFAFLLTRHWVVRSTPSEKRAHFTGVWQGIAAALFIWFSPDMLINAHAWVQWDTWVVPWYLAAIFLASVDWWFAAGVAIAIGINFKGQMIPITPIFLIWPLVQRRFSAALRWISGVIFCYALIVSGWLLTYIPPDQLAALRDKQADMSVTDFPLDFFAVHRRFDVVAAIWIFEMVLIVAAVPWLVRLFIDEFTNRSSSPEIEPPVSPRPEGERSAADPNIEHSNLPPSIQSRVQSILQSRYAWITSGFLLIGIAVFWPWLLPGNRRYWYTGLLAAAAVATLALFLPRRNLPYLLAVVFGLGLFACMWLFHGDSAWYDCAVRYGSNHWPYLEIGATSNVPAYFQFRFNWSRDIDDIAFTLPTIAGHWPSFLTRQQWWPAVDFPVTDKLAFNTIYGFLLLLSGIAIAIQTRRNDRRALIAFVTPWLMFFLWPVQIQERYLLYGAAISACCIGESVGVALLGLCLTFFSLMMPTKEVLDTPWSDLDALGNNLAQSLPHICSPQFPQTLRTYLDGTQPDIAWGVLVIAFVFLYLSLVPSQSRRKELLQNA
jgi:hypothetical protein